MRHATLTCLWWGKDELPMPGHYLRSARGKTSFLIVEVRRPKRKCGHVAKFVCERRPWSEPGPKDVCHGWQWSKRS